MIIGLSASRGSILGGAVGGAEDADNLRECDLLISDGKSPSGRVNCSIALIPGDNAANTNNINAEHIVTYGLSGSNAVTMSSLSEGKLMCTVTRDIPTVNGGSVEQRDFPAPRTAGAEPEEDIAAAAARLIMTE